jgi:hypothetical protein
MGLKIRNRSKIQVINKDRPIKYGADKKGIVGRK